MRPFMAGLAQLGLAGSCLFWTGCGGSDVPDPDSDSNAATDSAPTGGGGPPPVVAEEAATPDPEPSAPKVASVDPRMKGIQGAAPAGGAAAPEAASEGDDETAAPEAAADAPAEEVAGAPASSPESSSATNEMLALANTPSPSDSADAEEEKADKGNAGGPGGAAGYPGMGGPGGAGGAAGYPGMGGPAGGRGQSGRPPGTGGPEGGAPGYPGMQGPGMAGAMGGAGRPGSDRPSNFDSPTDGVTSFLNALEAKDLDRLAEATAKHAPLDAKVKNRKLFTEILEGSLSQEDLDDLATRLDGFTLAGMDPPKSTGERVVNIQKQEGQGLFGRKITTRHEKAGWKVMDIGGEIDFYNIKKTAKGSRSN